jgi:hypothetical protein
LRASLRVHDGSETPSTISLKQASTIAEIRIERRPDAKADVTWHVAMRPGKRKALDKENNEADALLDQAEKLKASILAKVEHPFRVIKRQFGFVRCATVG